MTAPLRTLLERLVSQDVARTNAAQASVRLIHDRRQVEAVEAFLDQHLDDQRPTSGETPPGIGTGRRRER